MGSRYILENQTTARVVGYLFLYMIGWAVNINYTFIYSAAIDTQSTST
jgi:hypothetical protein